MSLLSTANRISLNGRLIGGFGLLMALSAGTSAFYNLQILATCGITSLASSTLR